MAWVHNLLIKCVYERLLDTYKSIIINILHFCAMFVPGNVLYDVVH
jgi:hypothetical protein